MGASTTSSLPNYHRGVYGSRFGKGSTKYKVKTYYGGMLGPVTAAIAACGISDDWQGIQVVPLDDADEIHFGWATPHDMDCAAPVFVRFLFIGTNADDTITLTCSYDQVTDGSTAADGATTFDETIPAKSLAASKVGATYWGRINGKATDYDYLFIKAIAGSAGNADGMKCWAIQIAYTPRTIT